ncbi:BACON domain-containing protein [Dictyobacter formicarum]|uniref:BACON domain-containing protein n=1 Tax=Dictyobacter formicarum TaxID=2778368 RepID=A0ABQ3VT16_9CHLR|nr:SpaA isopeptide-forming pilin-related protein [Dictyobacter formicarum]GHO88963.1 hypothetical protein KSZ_69690 [Dictyobacter formicarum]
MNQCLRCNQPCSASAILCDQCRLQLKGHGHQGDPEAEIASDSMSSSSSSTVPMDVFTVPMDAFYPEPDIQTPDEHTWSAADEYSTASDHSFHMLNNAARMIAEMQGDAASGSRSPRASRLSPLRDISADIRRESTPLPATAFSTEHMRNALDKRLPEDLDERLPDLWPWLHAAEIDEEKDEWIDHADPLLSRRFPSAQVESNNLRTVLIYPAGLIWQNIQRAPRKWLRLSFIVMCTIAIVALAIDAVLVTFLEHGGKAFSGLPPTMTLSTRFANQGDFVTIHLKDFTPTSAIVLSHDIQEHVKLIHEGDIIHVGPQGSKDVVMVVEDSWEAGSHTIEAEDIKTRYTASAVLSVGVGPTRPAHLQLESTNIDLGSSWQGGNTLRPIRLDNTGGGMINWAASSSTSWLMFTPNQGMFSDHQDVQIAVDRTKLEPGSYEGKITISSNVSEPQDITVHMKVMAIPANAGAVLDVSPPVMSFTSADGMADPATQALVISNLGKQPLHWSVRNQPSNLKADNNSYISNLVGFTSPWVTASITAGTVPPGGSVSVNINVHSQALLPGTYTAQLQFQDLQALDSPQTVGVSLMVQPRCSLLLSTGNLLFTTVAGQSGANSQVLNLVGNTSCGGGNTNWSASSSVPWLTITPNRGSLMNAATASTIITANTIGMSAGTYNGVVTISMTQSTQTVAVQLIIQPPPPPLAPIIGASPLNLNFSITKGQANPPGQSIAIANTGGSALTLAVIPNPLSKWLSVVQGPAIITAGQTSSLMVNVDASNLTPGSYTGQIALSGVDSNGNPASGSPQTIGVTFTVFAPCTLTFPSATSLAFNAVQGDVDPPSQQVTFTAAGNCNWPLKWKVDHSAAASWLKLSPDSGQFTTSGQSATVVVDPSNAGLLAGNYSESVTLTATDSMGNSVPGSPQTLSMALALQMPCTFQSSSPGLTFSAIQGQTATQQSIPLGLSGLCVLPVSWTATADSSWLQLSSPSGSDNGQGSTLGVSVDATGLNVGTYHGVITVTPNGSGGASVDGKPQIPVTLTVTGTTVSVTVNSCATTACSLPTPLPGALVSLADSTGKIVASQTTDANGVATFTNVPVGAYTAVANGTDVAQVLYSGSSSVSVVGNVVTMSINAFASTPTPSP